jgi:predicted component of type VI protein secretion system
MSFFSAQQHLRLTTTPHPPLLSVQQIRFYNFQQTTDRMEQTLDVSKLSEADQKELHQILQTESQKAAIQQSTPSAVFSFISTGLLSLLHCSLSLC